MVKSWVADANIDYLSPQLYTEGIKDHPNFTVAPGCSYDMYKNSKGKMIPSMVDYRDYDIVEAHFKKNFGITTEGYIQWDPLPKSTLLILLLI